MQSIRLTTVQLSDLLPLQTISVQTFSETFSAHNTEENLKQYIDEKLNLRQLEKELQNPFTIFFFAMLNDTIVGYLKLNWNEAQTEQQDKHAIEIERIYVLHQYQGKQIGKMLLDKALAVARQKAMTYIWLGVWEENSKALRFYQKYGFTVFDKHSFVLGTDVQTDLMMKLPVT